MPEAFPSYVRCDTHRMVRRSLAGVPISMVARKHSVSFIDELPKNQLLVALSAAERDRLIPHLEAVDMPLGKVLYESGDTLRHVYFPIDCIVSLLFVMEDGASAEISVVGNEGIIGVALFMGGENTPSRAIVQSAGRALRLRGQQLKDEFHRNGGMQLLLLRYTQALITQMAQTAVCNRHHSLDQQLCRWLLLSLDRLRSNKLTMTQQLIANIWACAARVSPTPRANCKNSGPYATAAEGLPFWIGLCSNPYVANATPWLRTSPTDYCPSARRL
jgi:CRP-like cAMP-binding protein